MNEKEERFGPCDAGRRITHDDHFWSTPCSSEEGLTWLFVTGDEQDSQGAYRLCAAHMGDLERRGVV